MKIKKIFIVFLLVLMAIAGASSLLMELFSKEEEIAEITCDVVSEEKIYLAVGESTRIDNIDSVEDDGVLSLDNGVITGLKAGISKIDVGCTLYEIIVSDLYTSPKINQDKDYLLCNEYSKEDNELLDTVLSYLIDRAGYGTRAGAVEAARFLTLRFKNKLNYFYENGRLDNDGNQDYADGEGRYYHKGLYLNEYKYEELDVDGIVEGPEVWGCELWSNGANGELEINGLDCSGFITWCLLNGGYNPGDIGSGINDNTLDLTDLGQRVSINNISFSEIKVGDLIGFDGHIGMIIGDDDSSLYVAQAYWVKDLQVSVYPYAEIYNSDWKYIIKMDDFYKADGNLSDMW